MDRVNLSDGKMFICVVHRSRSEPTDVDAKKTLSYTQIKHSH